MSDNVSDIDKRRRAKKPSLPQRPLQHPDAAYHEPGIARRSPQQPTGPLEKATVAAGRVLDMPLPSGEKKMVGYSSETGQPVEAVATKRFGPGDTVELPASEAKRLRKLGFLHDPNRIVPAGQPTDSLPRDSWFAPPPQSSNGPAR